MTSVAAFIAANRFGLGPRPRELAWVDGDPRGWVAAQITPGAGLDRRALFDGRDVRPDNDYRGLFKGLLHEHMGVGETALEEKIFPESRPAAPMLGLVRRA